jgi:hypothetical protein
MAEFMFEVLKVSGLGLALLLTAGVAWAMLVGLWRAVTGEHRRHQAAVSGAWMEGWNAAMRGMEADSDEWARRMSDELDR